MKVKCGWHIPWYSSRPDKIENANLNEMPFTLIKGTFRPDIGIPDGDSVRSQPNDPSNIKSLPGIRWRNGQETVQLRYEGIDALEKSAILPHSKNARDFNLGLLSGDSGDLYRTSSGYILARAADGKSGRPICFVFMDSTSRPDGSQVSLAATELRESVNYKILASGLAYPLFYETLYAELREMLRQAIDEAKKMSRGHINLDVSMQGVAFGDKQHLGKIPPIFPKLYRRLMSYSAVANSLERFLEWLVQNEKEEAHTLSDDRFHGFEKLLEIKQNSIRLLYPPEDIVFRPKRPRRNGVDWSQA